MAYSFDTSLYNTGTGNPQAFNYTCGAGATLLVLGITTAGAANRFLGAAYAPTYGGKPFLPIDGSAQTNASCESYSEAWYLLSPSTGAAYSISVPNTSKTLYLRASSYIASSGTSLFDASSGRNATTGANPSTNIALSSAGMVVGFVSSGAASLSTTYYPAVSAGTRSLLAVDHGQYVSQGLYNLSLTTNASFGAVYSTDDWSVVVGSFKEPASAITYNGILKFWNGTQWTECPSSKLKYYNGSTMAIVPNINFKFWNGSDWKYIRRT